MEIRYDGPRIFEDFIEDAYQKVKDNFERKNPQISFDFPGGVHMPDMKERGFETKQEFFDDVEKSIQKIIMWSEKKPKDLNNKSRIILKEADIFATLKARSNLHYILNPKGAYYKQLIDTVYLDAFIVTGCYLRDNTNSKTLNFILRAYEKNQANIFNITDWIEHEMVHYDIGNTHVSKNLRSKIINLYEDIHILSPMVAEKKRKKHEALNMEYKKAGFHLAEEALAYCFTNERIVFQDWLRHNWWPRDEGILIFEKFEKKIKSQGKKATLIDVKKTFDKAFLEKKTFQQVYM